MARQPRLHLPGGLYHVMLRGNGGQSIFCDDEDRLQLEALVAEGVSRFGHRIHAYCWMGNHIHLALQVGTVPLSRVMQNLGFRYTRYFNRRYARVGHLFQGRFKAILVDAESYLLELVRYIHLNPLRAGLVGAVADYSWSGHQAYLGQAGRAWLYTDWVLSQFGPDLALARWRYGEFVAQGQGGGYRSDFHAGTAQGRLLGDEDFVARSLAEAGEPAVRQVVTASDVCRAVCAASGVSEVQLSSLSRARHLARLRGVAAYLIVEHRWGSLAELARIVNRDLGTLSRAAQAVRQGQAEPDLQALIQRVEQGVQ